MKSFYLHRIGADGWRKNTIRFRESRMPEVLIALRHVGDFAWWIRRENDNVIVAQSKNAQDWR